MERTFSPGKIEDVILRPIKKFCDERGWLAELWRVDNIPEPVRPVMTYISQTSPGVLRGPHEHVDQTDYFCFLGPGNFKLYLWDNRPESPSFDIYQELVVGQDNPMIAVIPPGVVHAYKNVSPQSGIVINCPNQLFRGKNYSEPVDEIRHEDDPHSPFIIE